VPADSVPVGNPYLPLPISPPWQKSFLAGTGRWTSCAFAVGTKRLAHPSQNLFAFPQNFAPPF
jgi:hypothetical protein